VAVLVSNGGMRTKIFQFGGQTYIGELVGEDDRNYYFANLKWLVISPSGHVVVMRGMLGMSEGDVTVPKGQVMIADASLEAVKQLMGGDSDSGININGGNNISH